MQQPITANKWTKGTLLVCIVTYLFITMRKLHLLDYADDQFFLAIFNSNHIIERLANRYSTWTGRFPLELLMTTTIGIKAFWKIAIPFSIVLLSYSMCRISTKKVGFGIFSFSIFLFSTIPNDINSDASWWITGFYNYLLPVSLAIYAFSISLINECNKIEKTICLIFACYFSYMEQAGLSYIIALTLLMLFRQEKRTSFNYIMLIFVSINLFISLKAPGNERRFILETWAWYPQYQTYGIFNKLSLGFDKLHQLMTFRNNIPLITLSGLLILLRSQFGKMPISVKLAMSLIISFVALSITNSLTGFFSNSSFFFGTTLEASKWSSGKTYLSYLYILFVISSLFIIMIDLFLRKLIDLTPIFVMLIGFMTVTMMGLSPTVYASGLRVDFMFEVMCIISSIYLSNKIPRKV